MRQAWHIFGKDVRRLWPFVLVWCAITAFQFLRRPIELLPVNPQHLALQDMLWLSATVAWLLAISRAVHQEVLTGTSQFWLARPYDWRSLLGAKILFGILCLHLPLAALDLACLARNGLPVWPSLPRVLDRHILWFPLFCLVPAAVAALTRNLSQFVLVALAALMAWVFGVEMLSSRWPGASWGMLAWIPRYAAMATMSAAAVAVLLVQYRSRRNGLARTLAALGVTGSLAVPALWPWRAATAVQTALHPGQARAIHLTIAGPREPAKEQFVRRGFVRVRVPVRLEGLGARDVVAHRGTTQLGTWHSGDGGEFRLDRKDTETFHHVFDVPEGVYRRYRDAPVRMEWTTLATSFVTVADHRVRFGRASYVPGVGRCESREAQSRYSTDNEVAVACVMPPGQTERVLVRVEGNASAERWGTLAAGYLAPRSTTFEPVQMVRWGWLGPRTEPENVTFRRLAVEATFPLRWTYDNFRLIDYVTWEPDQRR